MTALRKKKAADDIKLDIGCGPNKYKGPDTSSPDNTWVGMDRLKFDGVDHVMNVGKDRWPFANGSVAEAHSSHCYEHLTPVERCHFMNELHRVLKKGAKCTLIVPHWSSSRAYGDPTHQWPPCGEFMLYYLDKNWRAANAPHADAKNWKQGYSCDFECTWGFSVNPAFHLKHQDVQQFALSHYKEAAMDMLATLTKK